MNATNAFATELNALIPGRDNAGARAALRNAFRDGGVAGVIGRAGAIAFQRDLATQITCAARLCADPRPVLVIRLARDSGGVIEGLSETGRTASTVAQAQAAARAAGYRVILKGGTTQVAPEEFAGVPGGAWVVTVRA